MPVYRDFLVYSGGIYEVQDGMSKFSSFQAVKVVGWGKEDDTEYWIIQNSWGADWGVNGFAYVKDD